MPPPTRELYQSANGDRWSLTRDDGKVQVLRQPSAAEGQRGDHDGKVSPAIEVRARH
jgi:hypothetical protein